MLLLVPVQKRFKMKATCWNHAAGIMDGVSLVQDGVRAALKRQGQSCLSPTEDNTLQSSFVSSTSFTMAPTDKQIKKAFKEGGKKGQDLVGMADMGGMRFFCVVMEVSDPKSPAFFLCPLTQYTQYCVLGA